MSKSIFSYQSDFKNVSHETFLLLDKYYQMLEKWNKKINLVSRGEVELLERHILDSLQLIELIEDKDAVIYDLGSGAGLPGIILSIAGYNNINLVEINHKKSSFLNAVKAQLGLSVNVINQDIRSVKVNKKADFIVSRAFAHVSKIVDFAGDIFSVNTHFLLHKSQEQRCEFEVIKDKYTFELKEYKNRYNNKGIIVGIQNLQCHK